MIPCTIMDAASTAGVRIQSVVAPDQGLTLSELVTNIPHDLSAMVVYAMLFGSGLFVWRAGRSAGRAGAPQGVGETGPESEDPPRQPLG